METPLKETPIHVATPAPWLGKAAALALALALTPGLLPAQTAATTAAPPPSNGGFFPLSEVHRGMTATAWTVFEGSKPEPMEVEILGVLRSARGPGQDMILAQLHGAKPEYTGVVAGMSGSPVYIGKRLLGSLSYRIGQFSKDPIAGITPIERDAGGPQLAHRARAPAPGREHSGCAFRQAPRIGDEFLPRHALSRRWRPRW